MFTAIIIRKQSSSTLPSKRRHCHCERNLIPLRRKDGSHGRERGDLSLKRTRGHCLIRDTEGKICGMTT
ncbi:hypothetical protein CEXT_348761 [Caerostris extrusa]|uniref:Uncharacterized protein n=1 Tax=Caerostris extrusa TaxID=172846 RepID=A0AAV4XSQ9_CAEEX|nr:hypothetical protein CEXT_348761 [Caerostris extrusa]